MVYTFVNQFWQHLRECKEEMKDNWRFLSLPVYQKKKQSEYFYWGGVREQGSTMLVRECYEKLFMLIEKDWNQLPTQFLLLGTPGVGKSFFIHYLVYRLLAHPITAPFKIIIQSGSQGSSLQLLDVSGSGGKKLKVLETDLKTVHQVIDDPHNYYIIDGSEPVAQSNAKTIMVSYPDPHLYEFYERHSVVKKLYMPIWSLAECVITRKHCYPLCEEKSFLINYEKLGGIPRFVLSKPSKLPVEDQIISDDYIKECLALLTNSKRAFLATLMTDTIYEPNEIVQYDVPVEDVTYRHHFVKLSSLYVTQIVLRNLTDKQRVELAQMMKTVAATHPFAMQKLEYFVQALLMGLVEEWPRRFKLRLLRGLRTVSDLSSIEFMKLDHVNCGFSRLMDVADIERLDHERIKRGYKAMWGIAVIPQASGIDGVYIDDNHVDLLYMKPDKHRKISANAIREAMTLFKRMENRKVWIQNICLEGEFEKAVPIDYEGFPEEMTFIDDNVSQFALGLSLSSSKMPSMIEVYEKSYPTLVSPSAATVASPRGGTVE